MISARSLTPVCFRPASRNSRSAAFGVILTAILSALFGGTAQAGPSDIDTTPTGTGAAFGQGPDASATFGQIITGPNAADHYLTSFTFYLNDFNNPFFDIAQVYAWNGTSAVGPALYTSNPFIVVGSSAEGFAYSFDTSAGGGVNMSSASQYVLLFTTVGAGNSNLASGAATYNIATDNPYADGGHVYNNSNSLLSGWEFANSAVDLSFKATFGTDAAAPEPGSFCLAGTIILGVATTRVRRRGGRRQSNGR